MALQEFRLRFGKFMMEFIGTLLFVLTIQIAVSGAISAAAFAIGLSLVVLVYVGGPISGGHYNPAISLCIFARGKMSMKEMLMYWLFQVCGAIVGALLGGVIVGKFVTLSLGDGYFLLQAFLAELCFTAFLCFTVLGVATNSKVDGNMYYGLSIGFVVAVGTATVGGISGGAFNPAVVIGLSVAKYFTNVTYMLWVVLANICGSLVGALCFYIVAPDEFEQAVGVHDVVDEARSLLRRGHHEPTDIHS